MSRRHHSYKPPDPSPGPPKSHPGRVQEEVVGEVAAVPVAVAVTEEAVGAAVPGLPSP